MNRKPIGEILARADTAERREAAAIAAKTIANNATLSMMEARGRDRMSVQDVLVARAVEQALLQVAEEGSAPELMPAETPESPIVKGMIAAADAFGETGKANASP